MTSERRKHRRFAVVIKAEVVTRAGRCPGQLLNISSEGALFAAPVEVALGSPAYLRFTCGGAEAEAIGAVVRVDRFGDTPSIGLHFHAGNDAYVDLVTDLADETDAARTDALAQISELILQLGAD